MYIAAMARSKMAPDERFETQGSNPERRGRRSRDILRRERKSLKHVPCQRRSCLCFREKRRSSKRRRAFAPSWPVWAAAQGLEFEIKKVSLSFLKLKSGLRAASLTIRVLSTSTSSTACPPTPVGLRTPPASYFSAKDKSHD